MFLFIRNAVVEDENFRYYSDSNGFGNIVQRTNKATGEQQVYDYWTDGKMRKLTKYEQVPNSTTTMEVDYYFDALGRRVAKKIKTRSNEFTNTYTYLANQDKILLAKSGDDKVQLQVDGQGIDEHWAQINKSGIRTFISDHLGTVINSEVTNDSKITGAFGEVLQAKPEMEATTNPLIYGYTGRQFEPETGLYFYRNRVYDQNSGRFLTKDPIGFHGGDMNLYRYVNNGPINAIDPLGLTGYLVSRDLGQGGSGAPISHNFIAVIEIPLMPEIYSFGPTNNSLLNPGPLAGANNNPNTNTYQTDVNAWNSGSSDTQYTIINASDDAVRNAVLSVNNYLEFAQPTYTYPFSTSATINSNTAAQMVANRAQGNFVETPSSSQWGAPGASSASKISCP